MSSGKTKEKMYYRIGEVARMFNVNPSLIRFWEKEFDIIQPKKNKRGVRLFTRQDIENFQLIYHLIKERGYTIKGAREKLSQNPRDAFNKAEVVKSLKKIRSFLESLKSSLDELYTSGNPQEK